MPKLTVPAIAKYTPAAQRREIRDELGAHLYFVIEAKPKNKNVSAGRSWAMRFRRPDGRTARLWLGGYTEEETTDDPVRGAVLSLRQARQLSNKIDAMLAKGIDVVEDFKTAKREQQSAQQTKIANAFGAAVIEYVADHRTRRWQQLPRRWKRDARVLGLAYPHDCTDPESVEPEIIPGSLADTWGNKPISDITGDDIHRVVDDARTKGIPGLGRRGKRSESRSRKLYGGLAGFFKWAHRKKRRINSNPCADVDRPAPATKRPRYLSVDEIRWFWQACDKIEPPFRQAVRLLLLSGQRLNEVAGMRDGELDTIWTIPGGRTKNHREHKVHLPPLIRDQIASVPRIDGTDYVFTTTGRSPISGWSKTKGRLDTAMQVIAAKEKGTFRPWQFHDLRRTLSTHMNEQLGVDPFIVEAILNHMKPGIEAVYNRAEFLAKRKKALERWCAYVQKNIKR
jgi:integrase